MERFQLNSYQTDKLKDLFRGTSFQHIEYFVDRINFRFEVSSIDNSIKGDNPCRENKEKKKATLLRDIAKQAQKLKVLLEQLNDTDQIGIDEKLTDTIFDNVMLNGETAEILKIFEEAYKKVPNKNNYVTNTLAEYLNIFMPEQFEDIFESILSCCEEAIYTDIQKISTAQTLDFLIDETIFFACSTENITGRGYLEEFLIIASFYWAEHIKLPIKYSESSLFIKYLAILLDTSSTEKVSKLASRSQWLKRYRPVLDFSIKNRKSGEAPSEDLLKEEEVLSNAIFKEEDEYFIKAEEEIARIKGIKYLKTN